MSYNYLGFRMDVGKKKPENIVHKDAPCPFCDRKHLENIIDTQDDIILLENKYQILENAYQLLVIEGKECHADMPDYTHEHMHKLIRFTIKHWLEMVNSKKYDAVILFKNHGPYSGGTMRHPHMQIIGINNVDYAKMLDEHEFEGISIASKRSVSLNISNKPRVGFTELNIAMQDMQDIDILADFVQIAVDFIMHHFSVNCTSYNLFFYYVNGTIYVKVMPRFATSPLFIGFNLKLVPNNLADIVNSMKSIYFC